MVIMGYWYLTVYISNENKSVAEITEICLHREP